MTHKLIQAAIAAAMLATPALASDQLAAAAGVEPGVYSTAELMQMISALEEGDNTAYRFVRDGGSEVVSSQSPFGDAQPRNAQLAAAAGVEPGAYSTAELARMIAALEENDSQTFRFVRDGGSEVVSSQSPDGIRPANAGKAQLAAALGVDPDDYTIGQLAGMYIDANG
jgi:hypothetical protein